jgi:hypothetical protein
MASSSACSATQLGDEASGAAGSEPSITSPLIVETFAS